MISVEEASARIIAAFAPTETQTVSIENATGRVLARDVVATFDQPPAPVSSMDGYAVRAADVVTLPAELRVIGSSPAGHPFAGKIAAGETVRIFTGGVVPDGADTIVIQENTESGGERVVVKVGTKPGQHIRGRGLDFKAGDILARTGRKISPYTVSLLAAADIAKFDVRRKPIVSFVATGDELSRPGDTRKPGGTVASSGYGLAALIGEWGAEGRDLGILPDSAEAVARIPEMAKGSDLIVTLGGASVGDHDLVQKALGPKGFERDFWKIAMRPGKPLIFGKLGATPLLGLPGNPVSTLVCAILFLRPAIATMLATNRDAPSRSAKLISPLGGNDSRQDYLRARTEIRDGELWAEAFAVQDSSMLRPLAQSDALIVRKPHAPDLPAGSRVDILPL